MYKILIVEDDQKLSSLIAQALERYGYETKETTGSNDVRAQFISFKPDLLILDINLPYMDGFYWCRQVRAISKAPILFLSARTQDLDQIRAIENGGDDYITKPFSMEVLIARIASILRRVYGEYSPSSYGVSRDFFELFGLFMYPSKNEIEFEGSKSTLSPKEFSTLGILAKNAGNIVTREDLLMSIWDDANFVDDNTLSVNMARVRRKLEDLGIRDAISTIRGQGYRLTVTWAPSEKKEGDGS